MQKRPHQDQGQIEAKQRRAARRRALEAAATRWPRCAARSTRVDEQIQRLIAERAHYAKEIGVVKGLTSTAEFYRPEREAQVLRKVVERNDGPLRDEEMVRLFRELMSACLAQEEPLKVAYLGPEGRSRSRRCSSTSATPCTRLAVPTIDEVFHEVESGTADFGVAPIENSSEGTVNIHTLDMFLTSPLKICGEIELRIHQHLMGRMEDFKDVKRVCSHPQSLAQCRGWLAQHLPDVEKMPVASNAEAARRARDEDGTAALAGDAAAKVYGLRILFNTVEDRDDNTTRFVVIGRKLFPRERQRQDLGARLGARVLRAGRPAASARAAIEAWRQHDAYRIAAVAQAEMGLRLLPGSRRPCRGRAGPQSARRNESEGVAVQGAGLVSESHPLTRARGAASEPFSRRAGEAHRRPNHRPRRQVDLASRADARRDRRGHDDRPWVSRERGLPRDASSARGDGRRRSSEHRGRPRPHRGRRRRTACARRARRSTSATPAPRSAC